jgi:hypothetical protein
MSQLRAACVAVILIVLTAACGASNPTIAPSMSAEDLVACQGIPAPRPSPPDFGPDDAYLNRIYEPLQAEFATRTDEFSMMYIDGIQHIIVIGSPHPTKAVCDDLHARFGPWIHVIQRGPAVLDALHT